jgi:hypothetical protein
MAKIDIIPAVAKRFPTFCKKCDSERYHIVMAHVANGSAKIECEVCHRKSTFSLTKQPSASAKNKLKRKTVSSTFRNWAEFKEHVDEKAAVPYNIKTKFAEKASILHPTFGLGLVLKSEAQKIEVAFEQGIKALIHNR